MNSRQLYTRVEQFWYIFTPPLSDIVISRNL